MGPIYIMAFKSWSYLRINLQVLTHFDKYETAFFDKDIDYEGAENGGEYSQKGYAK